MDSYPRIPDELTVATTATAWLPGGRTVGLIRRTTYVEAFDLRGGHRWLLREHVVETVAGEPCEPRTTGVIDAFGSPVGDEQFYEFTRGGRVEVAMLPKLNGFPPLPSTGTGEQIMAAVPRDTSPSLLAVS